METHDYLWWILFLPLVGAALCGILHFATLRARARDPESPGFTKAAGLVGSVVIAGSLILSIKAFFQLRGLDESARVLVSSNWDWINVADLQVGIQMWLDPLSSLMTLIVTGVSFLIHVYSIGYMHGDKGFAKFFSYLNLFVFAMLMLVLSKSLVGLFIGWEGVGLCSYLLIGFWYEKGWPAEAGQKAFVVNRIGDACFLVGSFMLFQLFGTLDMVGDGSIGAQVAGLADAHPTQLAVTALLLFGGACGKSAQIPLFTWLPDAMAGPTPVSALIHAATMVTSGIYMIVRLNPLFAASPNVLFFIGCVAALTAFVAGSTALVQRDIKKVLAYSTVSQLGYMFLALGVGAWSSAMFHLMTHAFFKALLFLGAGSVIHGMHEEQDMHKMGGLKKYMPRTFLTFLCGAGALSGLPLLSGFFSKDEILALNFAAGGRYYVLWGIGIITAVMTAYYTWRMVALTFFGKERFDAEHVHPHESPSVMTVPLIVLAVLSVAGGVLCLPAVLPWAQSLATWLAPVTSPGTELLFHGHETHLSHATEWVLLGFGTLIAVYFAIRGFRAHRDGLATDEEFVATFPETHRRLTDAWTIDTTYKRVIIQPVKLLAFIIAVIIDQFGIDGVVNAVGSGAKDVGRRLRALSSGGIASYGLWMGGAAVVIALVWMWGGAR